MIVTSLSVNCAAVYYCARVDLAQDRPLSITDLARRTHQYPIKVRHHLDLLGELGLIPTEAPRPLLIEEVRAQIGRLLLERTYPTVRELHACLPHRSRVAVDRARALLADNGVVLQDRKHKPTPLTPPTPQPPAPRPPRRYGPCHLEIVEYRHAWKRIQTTILQTH